MKILFKNSDKKTYEIIVSSNDVATFESGNVHQVLSTFAIGKCAEWVCRLFAIDMKDEDEEGIGTFLEIIHHNPALIGEKVIFTGSFDKLEGNEIFCNFTSNVGDRIIASGKTRQKILKKDKIDGIFKQLNKNV